jgi:hypothetical protein
MGHLIQPGRSVTLTPLPSFTGEEGPVAPAMGGEGLYTGVSKTLTSQAFGSGPSSPAKSGRGEEGRVPFRIQP